MQVGELFVVLGLDTSQYDAAMKQAEKKANTLGDILRNALSFTLGMGLFEAIKQGFKAVVGEAVNFNSMMEQARIGFSTMLGSAEKAQAFLSEMSEFAAKTPFEFPELLDAAKRMMAYGFAAKDVLPTIRAVGDASAALGLGTQGIDRIVLALRQMRAKGKVSGEEMRQLAEAGIPAWEMLAEAMGKSTAEVMKLAERGLIPANIAIQTLVDGMEKRFPNMMAKMQDTWQGITSTLKDVWRMTVGAITSELFKGVTAWLGRLRDMANNFYSVFTLLKQQGLDTATALKVAISYAFGAGIGSVASMIINAVQWVWQVLVRAAVIIRTYWDSIRFVLLTVLSALFMFKVVLPTINWFITLAGILNGTLTQTSGLFGLITRAVEIYRLQLHLASLSGIAFSGVLANIRLAIYAVYSALGPLGAALLVISALLGGLMWLWGKYSDSVQKANTAKINIQMSKSLNEMSDNFSKAGDSAHDAVSGMKDVGKATSKASKAAKGGLAAFDEVHTVLNNMASAAEGAAMPLPSVDVTEVSAQTDFAMPEMPQLFDFEMEKPTVKGFLKWMWDEVKNFGSGLADWLKGLDVWSVLKNAWDNVVTWGKNAWDALKGNAQDFVAQVIGFAKDLWAGLKPIVEWLIQTLGPVFKEVFGFVVSTVKNTATLVVNVINSLLGTLAGIVKGIRDVFKGLIDFIVGVFTGDWNRAWEGIKLIFNGIWTAISSIWNGAKGIFIAILDYIRNVFIGAWQSIWNSVKSVATSIWNGLSSWLSTLWNSISSTASSVWKGIGNTIIRFVNGIINAINGMIRGLNNIKINIPSWVPVLGGKSLGFNLGTISTIPYLAQGGIVTSPTLAMVGEAGAEAVLPLERNTGWIDELARKLAAAMQGTQVGSSGDVIIQIGGEEVGRIAIEQIRRAQRQAGKTLIPV